MKIKLVNTIQELKGKLLCFFLEKICNNRSVERNSGNKDKKTVTVEW